MQSNLLEQWWIGLALFRPSAFREIAQAYVTRAAAAIVAAGGLIVNGAGALMAGLSAEAIVASALAGVAAALLAWACLSALAALLASRWLRAPLALRLALRVAGFASVWRWAGVVPVLSLAGDVLAAVALGVALATLAPGKPGRVVLASAACVGVGAVAHMIAGRLVYAALLALWAWIGSLQL